MPQRTNPFQDLVTLIQESLAPVGAKITPSAMVPGPSSGSLREIDVLVETAVGPYSIKIAVEAKDEGRKIDATKMEAIIGKYRSRGGILVNKVVVVSHSGFTAEAEVRAIDEDIDLFTVEEAEKLDWKKYLPMTFNLHFDPFPLSIEYNPSLPSEVDAATAFNHGRFICRCHGYDYGTPHFWMHQFIFKNILPNPTVVEKMHQVAINGKGKADLHVTMQMNHTLRINGQDYPLNSITMHFRYVHTSCTMTSKMYQMSGQSGQSTTVIHSQGSVGLFDIKMLLPMGTPEGRGILKIEGKPTVDTEEYKGPYWRLEDGKWVEEGEKSES
jgi:hypothetical protein